MRRATTALAPAAASLLALALGACALGGNRAPDTRLPTASEAPKGPAALTPAELDRWWLLFDDAALNSLEDEAFRLAPDARTATQRLLEARATRDSLVAQTLPSGPLSGNVKRTHTQNLDGASSSLIPVGGDTTNETLNFNVSWELDFFGRLAQARKVANGDLAATRFNIEGARAALAASVADDYFQVRGLAIQLQDARETARVQGELLAIAQKKAQLGLGAAADADRVAGDLAQAKSQVASLEAELHAAQRVLLVLIGRGADPTSTVPSEPVVSDPPPPPQSVPGELLARRPDVREA
ncbi:MAG TPA: TolC family protein, partial [Caulobacteraceae bacterium]|nr:TolC family protein [Caulobacteraceae bacterium]